MLVNAHALPHAINNAHTTSSSRFQRRRAFCPSVATLGHHNQLPPNNFIIAPPLLGHAVIVTAHTPPAHCQRHYDSRRQNTPQAHYAVTRRQTPRQLTTGRRRQPNTAATLPGRQQAAALRQAIISTSCRRHCRSQPRSRRRDGLRRAAAI